MPWCDTCSEFRPPEALTDAGACPGCDAVIGAPAKIPWHFKLLVLAIIVYLGWRAVQGAAWLASRL